MTGSGQPGPRNRLLAALPPDDLARLRPKLEPVKLDLRHTVQAPDEAVSAVHFPETGWVSMMAHLGDGGAAEVGIIGREGMVGLPLLFGTDRGTAQGMVQGPGTALRLGAGPFREALDASPALRALLLRYAMAHHEQVAQTAACNGRHQIEHRLARWLLMAHDRAEGDEFPMTHEFLALMLGVQRPGVSLAAGILQKAGLIRYGGGRLAVADRPGLEAAACECYGTVRREFERLIGPAAGA